MTTCLLSDVAVANYISVVEMCGVRALPVGACRGAKPLCVLSIPQDWGTNGG
jgi:hypothetical protein